MSVINMDKKRIDEVTIADMIEETLNLHRAQSDQVQEKDKKALKNMLAPIHGMFVKDLCNRETIKQLIDKRWPKWTTTEKKNANSALMKVLRTYNYVYNGYDKPHVKGVVKNTAQTFPADIGPLDDNVPEQVQAAPVVAPVEPAEETAYDDMLIRYLAGVTEVEMLREIIRRRNQA